MRSVSPEVYSFAIEVRCG